MKIFQVMIEKAKNRTAAGAGKHSTSRSKYNFGERGFTLMEIGIAIPIMGLIGAVVFMMLAMNITQLQNARLASSAASDVARVMDRVDRASSCGEILAVATEPEEGWESEDGYNISVNVARAEPIAIENIEPAFADDEVCHDMGAIMRVSVSATTISGDTTLYSTTKERMLASGWAV